MLRSYRVRAVITLCVVAGSMHAFSVAAVAQEREQRYDVQVDGQAFEAINQIERTQGEQGGGAGRETEPERVENVEPAALPTDDGIDYSYERVCTSQPEENLDPSYCVALNAQCDAQEDGILVEWIEIDRNQSPPTQTPTGRNGCLYPGQPPVAPTGGEPVAGEPAEAPIIITLTEFESQPLIAAAVISQPQNFGLRNANSNVYAEAQEQEFTFGFRNADIRLRAWPVSYEWNYGDGTSRTTADGGGPAQSGGLDVETSTSHKYTETGDYEVNLVTYFAGDYSVNGGPWQPVAGEAAVASEPHLMSIWRSERHSVAENCIENPSGVGC